MTAHEATPASGECVSEESELPDEFEQLLLEEIDTCRLLLRQTLRQDVDVEDVAVRVREAKARLEYLDRQTPVNQSLSD